MDDFDPSEYTIMVVDDVLANVMLVKAVLKSRSYKVVEASNGKDAIEKVKENKPDLILMDVMMPVMNGHEAARILKEDPDTEGIPIIFLTALSDINDVVSGFDLGASDYISKPFKPALLRSRVDRQIRELHNLRIIVNQREELAKVILNRDRLYSVIAHDLRSPIGTLKMIMNLLTTSMHPQDVGKDLFGFLVTANEITENSFELLENLLKWTRTQTKGIVLNKKDTDIIFSINDVVRMMSSLALEKDIKIKVECEYQTLSCFIDLDIFTTIIRNLLSNAIKFSFKGSEIEVIVKKFDAHVLIKVVDHGKGIREEDKKKIFDSGTKFTTSGTNDENGSGFGLLLCKEFAQKNNGELTFESEYNNGSTFMFTVPLSENN